MIKIITYAARILSIIIIVFFAFFLTARNAPVLGDLSLIREIFTLIVTGITIVAWRIPMMGGVLFLLFGIRYFIMIARPGDINSALMIMGLFILTGVLFMWEGYHTNKGNKPLDKKYWFN